MDEWGEPRSSSSDVHMYASSLMADSGLLTDDGCMVDDEDDDILRMGTMFERGGGVRCADGDDKDDDDDDCAVLVGVIGTGVVLVVDVVELAVTTGVWEATCCCSAVLGIVVPGCTGVVVVVVVLVAVENIECCIGC